jgi:Kef-type K+ transport system membrane component KefB
MAALELIILIGVAVLAGEATARRFRLPPSLILLVIGSGLSFVPRLQNIDTTLDFR